jgi:protein-S-isoprenylcysteine O-methyltransferase Ste14
MIPGLGWGTYLALLAYLAAFFQGSALAAHAAGRPVWLFARATGRDRLAVEGFRAAFGLAALGPPLWLALPPLQAWDPLWTDRALPLWRGTGHVLSVLGAMTAFAAQMSMGASWRIGVDEAAVGTLVDRGLFAVSRNPVFTGQIMLLAGLAIAVPSLPGVVATTLFWLSARAQIRREEQVLAQALGAPYGRYLARVPRWIGRRKAGCEAPAG